jgi:peptidoglycan/LPS O-acetylase OafA/YrhL
MLFSENRIPNFSNWQAAWMVLAGVYLFCFSAGEEHFIHAPIKAMLPDSSAAHFVWDLSAALIIMVLLGNAGLHSVFSKTWAVWLGKLSFPIYLLHVPIMLSAGAVSILAAIGPFGIIGAVLLSAAVTVALTFAFALPLAWIDKIWTSALTRVAMILVKRRPAP